MAVMPCVNLMMAKLSSITVDSFTDIKTMGVVVPFTLRSPGTANPGAFFFYERA